MRLEKHDHRSLVLWATECAEHILPYFEQNHPKDNRPRSAIEARRAWARSEISMSEARAAALDDHASAREADQAAARAARSAGHAAHAANYALKAASFASAADPTDSGAATARERDWQYRRLPEHLWPAFPARGDD